jgi:hypothetical protein
MRHNHMASTVSPAAKRHPLDWPVYWFAALERAIEAGDWQAAAEAQRELERLGVTVQYRPRDRQEVARA